MSRGRLTESLLGKRDARARAIWQEAELRASHYRQAAEDRCAAARQTAQAQHDQKLGQQLDQLANRIEKRARRVRLFAEEKFAERLWRLAVVQLARLPTDERSSILQRLTTELPEFDWQRVTVHPDDRLQAVRLFPNSTIDTDPALIGGLTVTTTDGAVSVNNSLGTRLVQIWPKLCGSVLDALQADKRE